MRQDERDMIRDEAEAITFKVDRRHNATQRKIQDLGTDMDNGLKMLVGWMFLVGFGSVVIMLLLVPGMVIDSVQDAPLTVVDTTELNGTLGAIDENCGSTYITRHPQKSGWYVFVDECKGRGYCKYDFVPLDECITGDT